MQTETRSPNMALARQVYSPEVRQLIHVSCKKTRYDTRGDFWVDSFTTSGIYSMNLGILLANKEAIAANNEPEDLLDKTRQEMRFMNKMLKENPVKAFIEQKQQQGHLYMLDLMSYGAVHKELGVTGCTVALSDRREEMEATPNGAVEIHLVTGDILSRSTWRGVNQYLTTHTGIAKFGVILCHPQAGLEEIPENIVAYQYLFGRIYDVLSSDEGTFLANFHATMYEEVKNLCEQLNAVPGIRTLCYPAEYLSPYGKFMLVRSPNSPDKLP